MFAMLGDDFRKKTTYEQRNFVIALDFDVYKQRTRNWTSKIIVEHALGVDTEEPMPYFYAVFVARNIFSKADAFSLAAEAFQHAREEVKVEMVTGDSHFNEVYGDKKTFIGYKRLLAGVQFVFGVLVDTEVLNR